MNRPQFVDPEVRHVFRPVYKPSTAIAAALTANGIPFDFHSCIHCGSMTRLPNQWSGFVCPFLDRRYKQAYKQAVNPENDRRKT